jgi:hypothetical protein
MDGCPHPHTLDEDAHKGDQSQTGCALLLPASHVRPPGDRAAFVLCREVPQNLRTFLQPDFDLGKRWC